MRERWVRGETGPEVVPRAGGQNTHTRSLVAGRCRPKRVVREGGRRCVGCVGVSSLRVSGWSGQKLHD